ncbi:hypothetical protein [Iodidimonas sp. SYSU 1G8]|uniref:hypothetical protein n=1 Tax=Iodidimonas sp. SYSU 1G8 TaxID=3133967 RepID=UPI0031FEB7CC
MGKMKLVLAYVAAVIVAAVLGVAVNTQFVVNGLNELGAGIGAPERLGIAANDVIGMGPVYGMFLGVALVIGFLITALVLRQLRWPRALGYAIGGAAAVAAMLAIMNAVLGITMVAGARTAGGFLAQCAVGAVAGWVFARLSRR